MNSEEFEQRCAKLIQFQIKEGSVKGLEACQGLLAQDLETAQEERLLFIAAQFMIELPERFEEGRQGLIQSIAKLRKRFVAGHPDRDQVELIARRAFGPQSLANLPDEARAWDIHQRAGVLSNNGQAAEAEELLESIEHVSRPVLRSHLLMARMVLSWNKGDPESALRFAQQAADVAATLEVGHWARREVEKTVLSRVGVIRKSIFHEPFRSQLSGAIEAVNEGDKNSLKLWKSAVEAVEEDGSLETIEEVRRIDRLLTGFSGPLALLVAFEEMKLAEESGSEAAILDATEAAYFVAYEHDAHSTAQELEAFLISAGRF